MAELSVQHAIFILKKLRYPLNSYDIPDPFATFVAKKYKNYKGYLYDFFTGEWSFKCYTCGDSLDAPSKKIMTKIHLYHTRNECLNGY